MRVEIDDKSGFCFGVVRAIDKAERALADYGTVYSLGDIVHNRIEVHHQNHRCTQNAEVYEIFYGTNEAMHIDRLFG